MSAEYRDITGYIMAGGTSARLGRDKRRLQVAGQTLLGQARARSLELLGDEPFVVGDNLGDLGVDPLQLLGDAVSRRGPLGGLLAILANCPTRWALVTATDLPFLRASDLRVLVEQRRDEYDVLTLSRAGRPEPLAALYQRRTHTFWRDCLEAGRLSLMDSIRRLRWHAVPVGEGSRALDNVNTEDDLDGLELT